MSVLINNMKMPKCCAECEWHEYYGGDYDWVHACRRTGTMPIENAETERANDCPLIEIHTPHGRLIDADALESKIRKQYCEDCDRRKGIKNGKMQICYEIGGAPCRACSIDDMCAELDDATTVIEAEKE
jgi:hypothetical protein